MLFEIYRGNGGQFRWRVRDADNLLILAAASQGYSREIDAVENAARVLNNKRLVKAYRKGGIVLGLTYEL